MNIPLEGNSYLRKTDDWKTEDELLFGGISLTLYSIQGAKRMALIESPEFQGDEVRLGKSHI